MNRLFSIWHRNKRKPKGNILRALSVKERLLLQRGEKDILQISSMIFTSSKYPCKAPQIIKSLKCITERHPSLQACVVKTSQDYYWRKIDEIKINYTEYTSTDLKEICSELLHHKHDLENGPLWQMIHFPDIADISAWRHTSAF